MCRIISRLWYPNKLFAQAPVHLSCFSWNACPRITMDRHWHLLNHCQGIYLVWQKLYLVILNVVIEFSVFPLQFSWSYSPFFLMTFHLIEIQLLLEHHFDWNLDLIKGCAYMYKSWYSRQARILWIAHVWLHKKIFCVH